MFWGNCEWEADVDGVVSELSDVLWWMEPLEVQQTPVTAG